ncbi:MAG: hypothetical protein ACRELC_00175, partial [Gemmatimonadota bacterium]
MTTRFPEVRRAAVSIAPLLVLACALPVSARAQQRTSAASPDALPIDRWLLSERIEAPRDAGVDPLVGPDGPLFPDRDLVVGPSYWHLVRDDGQRRFDLAARLAALATGGDGREPKTGAAVLAHAYLKSPADRTVRLALEAPACAAPSAWLNGQRLLGTPGPEPLPVRLAGGWNTLLVRLVEAPGCGLEVSAALLPVRVLDEEGRPLASVDSVRVRASRPPGVRRNYPEPGVTIDEVAPDSPLVWRAESEDLVTPLRYRVTAWGRGTAEGDVAAATGAGGAPGRPSEPPAVDLTGEWDLRLISPLGIEEATAAFQMSADGTLEGELRADRFRGPVREGWVSGSAFAFTARFSGPGGEADVRFEGVVTDETLSGTIDLGRLAGFESRFEGTRAGAETEGERGAGEEETGAGGREPDAERAVPAPEAEAPRAAPGPPGAGGGGAPDLEELRATIRAQLLPPREPPAPAPRRVDLEIEVAGEEID